MVGLATEGEVQQHLAAAVVLLVVNVELPVEQLFPMEVHLLLVVDVEWAVDQLLAEGLVSMVVLH